MTPLMTRRRSMALLATLAAQGVTGPAGAAAREARGADWRRFAAQFVAPDGRVIDTGNNGRSHSEGQGYGMLLAEAHGDADAFLRMWRWTRAHLMVRDDALLAWAWDAATASIEDRNNATDGDILVAWALLRGFRRWGEPAWRKAAAAILADVVRLCVVENGSSRLLLPGVEGFRREDGVVVNPSYWVFPAFEAFLRFGIDGPWSELAGTGEALIEAFAATRRGLPPDWCLIGASIGPAPDLSFAFGFDAVRVPLYHRWAAPPERSRRVLRRIIDYVAERGPGATPARLDLLTGEASAYRLSTGGQAVALLAADLAVDAALVLPEWRGDEDYYSAALLLLAQLAAEEMPA